MDRKTEKQREIETLGFELQNCKMWVNNGLQPTLLRKAAERGGLWAALLGDEQLSGKRNWKRAMASYGITGIVKCWGNRMNTTFTPEAASHWQFVPAWIKETVLTYVWCSQCQGKTTMVQVTGELVAGDLLLIGLCNGCGAKVARLVEGA
jgi:hypothetical protein